MADQSDDQLPRLQEATNGETTPREVLFMVESIPEIPSTYRRQNDCLLTALCCIATLAFFPLGLLAMYFLYKAKRVFRKGRFGPAKTYGMYANFLSLISILFGMVWIGLVIGLTV